MNNHIYKRVVRKEKASHYALTKRERLDILVGSGILLISVLALYLICKCLGVYYG